LRPAARRWSMSWTSRLHISKSSSTFLRQSRRCILLELRGFVAPAETQLYATEDPVTGAYTKRNTGRQCRSQLIERINVTICPKKRNGQATISTGEEGAASLCVRGTSRAIKYPAIFTLVRSPRRREPLDLHRLHRFSRNPNVQNRTGTLLLLSPDSKSWRFGHSFGTSATSCSPGAERDVLQENSTRIEANLLRRTFAFCGWRVSDGLEIQLAPSETIGLPRR
jgi:hypothetical protein